MASSNQKNTGRRVLLYLLSCVCLAGVGYSGYKVYTIQTGYSAEQSVYNDIRAQMAAPSGTPAVLPSMPSQATPAASAAGQAQAGRPSAATAAASPSPKATRPPSQMDFAALRELNGDSVAWITLAGSAIDYPVVQGRNNSFYLNHLFTGRPGKAGAIFMEAKNAPDFSDKNTILFGHHMKDGSMFADLNKYRQQAYYDEHPVMTLYTPQGDYRVEWFAGRVVQAAPIPITFKDDEAFMAHVQSAAATSDFAANVQVSPADQLLTLSTCTNVAPGGRYVLIGVLR